MMARLGGIGLLIGGALGLGLVPIALAGGAVGLGTSDANGLLVAACLGVLGLGAGAVSLSSSSGHPRMLRLGLGLDALGLVGLAVSAQANGGPDTSPLLLVLLGSLALLAIGLLVTVISLLRLPGLLRLGGGAMLVGMGGLAIEIATGSSAATFLLGGIPLAFVIVGLVSVRGATPGSE